MRRPALLLALVLAAAAAACGESAPVPAKNRTIGLRLDEYRILPQRVSAPAGRLRLIVRNRGILTHNVTVQTIPPPGGQAETIARAPTVQPGARSEVTFTIGPGTYELVCKIGNHDDLGQVGELIVR